MDVAHAAAATDLDFSTFPAASVTLPAFRLLRVDVAFAATPRWRWHFAVDNALDVRHETVYGYRGPGRTVLLKAEAEL